ncbi:GIY-YIG nuclease family protein [Algoriphagus namhaensis]|uniref:GIY-YIG nuclease family protein n=1 Tax=Algoriphagus namhaensis TaxID=915353 RepID=A0ABV8AUE6_9BACT
MSSFFVYVIYSPSRDKYYVGQTSDLDKRLEEHNSHFYSESYTSMSDDWILTKSLPCQDRALALKIEKHIKKNRSRKYVDDFVQYPSIGERLISKYSKNEQ